MKRAVACLTALTLAFCLPDAPAAVGKDPALSDEPFTVIAVIDSGINPYHEDFRRTHLNAHPSTYIDGFPRGTRALNLTLDAANYDEARLADDRQWKRVEPNKLYWIPGTNIIGAIGPFDMNAPVGVEHEAGVQIANWPPIIDEVGHGTPVASLAAGGIHGPSTDRTLIVAIQGFERALRWAARQPWIDVITNSWWNLEADDYAAGARASRAAVRSGKVVCFASGNFSHPQLYTGTQGPSWSVNVGAASATTRGEHYYTNYPNDVLGLSGVKAAAAHSLDSERNFTGTSAAAPGVCGLMAKTIGDVRALLGDARQGARRSAMASGRRLEGLLGDGRLSREELEDAIQSTAIPAEPTTDLSDPNSIPALPEAAFVRGGYGIVDRKSVAAALDVILGRKPRPDRSIEDAWIEAVDAIRDVIWKTLSS